MVEFAERYLWELFLAVEVVFWLCLVVFMLFRYVLGWRKISLWVLPAFLFSVLADAYLGWVDYQATGEFSLFQFIVVIFILYAFISGYADFRRLDAYVARKIAHWKGEPEPEANIKVRPTYGRAHARHERRGWYAHVLLYFLAQLVFAFLFGTREGFAFHQLFEAGFYQAWWQDAAAGMFEERQLNQMAKGWFFIVMIDGILSLSYTISPRKEKTG